MSRSKIVLSLLFVLITAMFAACGSGSTATEAGDAGSNSEAGAGQTAVPTMPSAQFEAVAKTAGQITETITVTTSQETNASAADLERGQRSYIKNKCNECHGEKGEGVPDKGNAIAGTTLSQQEFDNYLRTGGGLGNTHIFGVQAVSPAGMGALYAYMQSLK
jgi:mono/diheme cytochrome c family protein